MFIQTETTPNPLSMKFIPGVPVTDGAPVHFASVKEAAISPLAQALFTIPEVDSVFLGSDFVTIGKKTDSQWDLIKPDILTTIMDHFLSGKPVLREAKAAGEASAEEDDSEIVAQIKELIETHVRPAVAQDGGDIVYRGFENGIVKLELHGACSGCPSSSVTLKNGIENMLKHYVPEVISVEAVND